MQRLALVVLAGCALTRGAVPMPPLQTEGELHVELQPLASTPGEPLELSDIAALRSDGAATPLELQLRQLSASPRQRLLARGRLEPGQYAGLLLQLRGGPLRIDAPFGIEQRRGTVLWLWPRSEAGAARTISFTSTIPAKTVAPLAGFCTASGSHDLVVFDKHVRAVTAALPTGRGPWGVALDPVQGRAFVSLSDDDQIAMFDIANGHELSRIRLAPGDSPRELLATPDRRLIVSANAGSNTVSFIDPLGMIEVGRVQVGEEPISLLPDRKTARFYVFNARSNSISVVDPGTRSVVGTAQIENTPLRGQIDRAGARLYVASSGSAYLTVYALPGLAVAQRVYVGLGTTALKVDPDTDFLYVANADGRVSVYDPFSLLPVDYFDAGGAVAWMSIDGAENVLFLLMSEQRSVAAIQMTTRAAAGGFDVGVEPRVLALMGERN